MWFLRVLAWNCQVVKWECSSEACARDIAIRAVHMGRCLVFTKCVRIPVGEAVERREGEHRHSEHWPLDLICFLKKKKKFFFSIHKSNTCIQSLQITLEV